MKVSINVFLFTALFVFMGFNADAQRRGGPPSPEDMAAKQTEEMTAKLGLSEGQAARVEAINLTFAERMQVAREDYGDNRSDMEKIMTAIKDEKSAEMKAVLSEEQYEAFEEMKTDQPQRRGRNGRGNRGGN